MNEEINIRLFEYSTGTFTTLPVVSYELLAGKLRRLSVTKPGPVPDKRLWVHFRVGN